jgi:signal transduction histidine kinase
MNENQMPLTARPVDLSDSPIRAQLLWAALFPLAAFGLLTTLVISTALYQVISSLAAQRNTAQAQVLAGSLAQGFTPGPSLTSAALDAALQAIQPAGGSQLYLVDAQGRPLAVSTAAPGSLPLTGAELAQLVQNTAPASRLIASSATQDEVMVSFAPLPGQKMGVVLTEPWSGIRAPAFYYQLVLVGLLLLGTALCLGMLYLSLGRVIRPIAALAENASGAIPGSVFHPIPENGPREIRTLINAFNQMVIRLAEQQSTLRQYAHKALLSQEDERQRLSHELHDGTVQDLVGLAQRVELCRSELDSDPQLARRRLDELQKLLEQTLTDVRRISIALRPPVLEDFGLSIALDALCKDLQQEKPSLRCDYILAGKARRLAPELELAVYRVVQEALANVRKHAQDATRVQVELVFSEAEIQATVKNDGAAFTNQDVRAFVRSGHIGLAGMYERASLFGGKLEISSDAAENTVVSLRLPCT